jgi:RimJ/RimL family protein N-acetyltransferase
MDDIVIRRVRPSDAQALQEFYAGLSAESRRQRFLGFGNGIAGARATLFCTPDHAHEEGFVALASVSQGNTRVVGHLCLAAGDLGAPEIGVAIADDLQGRRIGGRLFDAALNWARQHEVERLTAVAFADNCRVLRLLSSAPGSISFSDSESGVVEMTISLRQTAPRRQVVPPSSRRERSGRDATPLSGTVAGAVG